MYLDGKMVNRRLEMSRTTLMNRIVMIITDMIIKS